MALDDPDARDARDRRTCLDCGGRTPEGRWRCDACQASATSRRARMVDTLRAARAEASRERHGEGD